MARPTVARRRVLARQGKAEPNGSYPTDTRGRAVAAKGYAKQAVSAGRMSAPKEAEIDRRADRELKNAGVKPPRKAKVPGFGGRKTRSYKGA